MIFRISFSVFLMGGEVFYWLIPYSVFLFYSLLGLRDFSQAIWLFETHQLPYGARMFSMVFRFSSLVSFIGMGGFLPDFRFFSTIPRSTELASKEGGNCNNVTLRAESSQSGSHITTIIQNFTLVSLTFIVTPHPVELSLGAAVPSLPTYLSFYTLNFLPLRLYTSRNFPLGYLSRIVHLSRHAVYHPRLS